MSERAPVRVSAPWFGKALCAGVVVAVLAAAGATGPAALAAGSSNPDYSNMSSSGYTVTDSYVAAGGDAEQSSVPACDTPAGSPPTLNQGGACFTLEEGTTGGIDEKSVAISLDDAQFGASITGSYQFTDNQGNPVGGSGYFCGKTGPVAVPQVGQEDGGTQGSGQGAAPAQGPISLYVFTDQATGYSGVTGACGTAGDPATTGTVTAVFSTSAVAGGGGGGTTSGTTSTCTAPAKAPRHPGGHGPHQPPGPGKHGPGKQGPGPAEAVACGSSSFDLYPSPFGGTAGETSIGWDPATHAAMFLNELQTTRVSFDDKVSPPTPSWADVSDVTTSLSTLDPMLFTDPATGRTFVSQDSGAGDMAYTDDDGASWSQSQPPVVLPSFDHPTIGAGPYSASGPLPTTNPVYPDATYYCAQDGADTAGGQVEQCARSDDGGLTWGAPVPVDTLQCSGSMSHVVVGPDGTVYLPNPRCAGPGGSAVAGVFVSHDDGTTWSLELDPTLASNRALGNAALAVDASSNIYLFLNSETAGGSAAEVAVSRDGGATWSKPVDVAAPFGVQNVEFPMAVAGRAGSAAVAFYGTTTGGDDQEATFAGAWEVYEAVTTDGGASWQTSDVTGSTPVQVGEICLGGQACTGNTRNLLDFQEMTADQSGRVLIGYADGCPATGACTQQSSSQSRGLIARQMSGPTLEGGFLRGTGGQLVPSNLATGFTASAGYVDVGGDAQMLCAHALAGLPGSVPDVGGGCYIGLPAGLGTLAVTIADKASATVEGQVSFKDSAGNAVGAVSVVCGAGKVAVPPGASDIYVLLAQATALTGSSCPGAGPGTAGTVTISAS